MTGVEALAGPPSQADRRAWSEQTPAGRLRAQLGVSDQQRSAVEVRGEVDAVADHYLEHYGRVLSDEERRALTASAQATGSNLQYTGDSFDLARRAGWAVQVENPAGAGRGLAMKVDGVWQGDPDVAARAEAAEAQARALRAEESPGRSLLGGVA